MESPPNLEYLNTVIIIVIVEITYLKTNVFI